MDEIDKNDLDLKRRGKEVLNDLSCGLAPAPAACDDSLLCRVLPSMLHMVWFCDVIA